MRILAYPSANTPAIPYVLVFGLGLIGSAITRAAQRLGYAVHRDLAYDWLDAHQQEQAFAAIESLCRNSPSAPGKLAIVWSAGQADFHSTAEDTRTELQTFVRTVGLCVQLQQKLAPAAFEFHLLSSAGGLFEGQTAIGPRSKPVAMRPYGALKLAQEQTLSQAFERSQLAFHRPSSVYGPAPLKLHKGLINNLIKNGQAGRVTVLDANVMALRDYIFAEDIGNYIARTIWTGAVSQTGRPERFLVSGRSTSIYEAVKKIERILNLKLRVRYDRNFGNHRNITFSRHVLPDLWKPTPLETGVRQFLVHQFRPI